MIFFLLAHSFTARAQTTNEAESATLANGAWVDQCKNCSAGKQVRGLGGDNHGTVTFDVRVDKAGLYPITILYNVGSDAPLSITINTNTHWDLIFFKTARRDAINGRTIYCPLKAGDNLIEFGEPGQPAPDLDAIVIGDAPSATAGISGMARDATGAPLAGVEMSLSGPFEEKVVTDAQGRYEFPFLPAGNYYVRPFAPQFSFAPCEGFCALDTNVDHPDFEARASATAGGKKSVARAGKWRISYDLSRGVADIFYGDKLVIPQAFAVVRLPETVTSRDYQTHHASQQQIRDNFGQGIKFTIESANGDSDKMIQTFWIYQNADYFLTDVQVVRKLGASSNFMSPLTTQTAINFLPAGDDRVLSVPFDNDKWIRYNAEPFGGEATSYEVSALYECASRQGLIVGSIDHDVWKTGVKCMTTSNTVDALEVFGGITSSKTRDVLPHGKISGESIRSPRVFVGFFADWRDGLDAYAAANATAAPPRAWSGGVPFGWNSWGKLQFQLSFDKAVQVSDFFAQELQPNNFENNGVVYIGLDSGWDRFSDADLKAFVDHCHSNHQEAGIYFTPFALWHGRSSTPITGTPYTFHDIYLYANKQRESIAGGAAVDPTHPGTQKLISDTIARFKQAGFTYVKADFLVHGALEADKYYDTNITTGIQAYNEGMKFVEQQLGDKIYLNESIAPLFPSQYADSRRISCDAFGGIWETEYVLNSLAGGWWLSKAYDFNDGDHVVLDGFGEGENRARVTAAVITGIFTSGDDFSAAGDATGKERAKKFLTNPEINRLARTKKSFRPVEGDDGDRGASLFMYRDGRNVYLAAFNFTKTNVDYALDLNRIGIKGPVHAAELWSGASEDVTGSFTVHLPAADAALYKFSR